MRPARPPRPVVYGQMISLRFTTEQLAQIDAMADTAGMTRAEVIRQAVGLALMPPPPALAVAA